MLELKFNYFPALICMGGQLTSLIENSALSTYVKVVVEVRFELGNKPGMSWANFSKTSLATSSSPSATHQIHIFNIPGPRP